MIPLISVKNARLSASLILPDWSSAIHTSMVSPGFIPGITASMCQPLRLGRIQVKSSLIVDCICCCNSSCQVITGSVKSLIRRLTPDGKLPAPAACAACSTASLISSRIASRSSLLNLGRPLPSLSPSPSPSPSPVPSSKCSSSTCCSNLLISIFSAFSYKWSYTSSYDQPLNLLSNKPIGIFSPIRCSIKSPLTQ